LTAASFTGRVSRMKHYLVTRKEDGVEALVIDAEKGGPGYLLAPRGDLRNHSPDGCEFSSSDSGLAQLSLALLADALGNDERALRIYQQFKATIVARVEGDPFELSQEDILQTVKQLETERGVSVGPSRDLNIENALLRGALFLAVASLKRYHDAPHAEIERDGDIPMMEVIVPEGTREKAAEAIERSQGLLRGREQGR
jgi:hypothetical protein